jgi:hypothetical protein
MQLLERIQKELQTQNKSVLKLSNETGISAYKIYKWFDHKGSPKHEDSKKLEDWLRNLEKNPNGPENSAVAENAARYGPIPNKDAGLHPVAINGQKGKDYRLLYEEILESLVTGNRVSQAEIVKRLDKLSIEAEKQRALVTVLLEHVARIRAHLEKKSLRAVQTEMGNNYFSVLGINHKNG